MTHEEYMSVALALAKRGLGYTSPNPMVGAVIVRNDKIIGSGWHEKCGELHAERNALKSCGESPKGATIYVTLEPCCHYGRTPPCTQAIIESGISRVVVGSVDPNPFVAGDGIRILKSKGIEVITDVLKEECDKLNYIFFHYITNKTPYVLMKYAMTADGKIATFSGKSKWITGDSAREHVHETRHAYSSIMVGIGTVIADNPLLNCRIENGKNPIRIICDSNLNIPIDSQIVSTAKEIPTIVATVSGDEDKITALKTKGIQIIETPDSQGKVHLPYLMQELRNREIDSVLLEGGASLNYSMISENLVNRIHAYIAPKVFGGMSAKSPIGGQGVESPHLAHTFKRPNVSFFLDDILLDYEKR